MRRLAAAMVVVVAACSSGSGASAPGWTDGTVAIVGDSMVFETAGEFERIAGERGWDLTIHAAPGTTFADNLGAIAELADSHGGAVVVELGTNDALTERSFSASEADDIDRAVESLRGVGCGLFVNAGLLEARDAEVELLEFWDDYSKGTRAAKALNRHLAAAVDGHANLHVFDWYTAFNRNLEWTRDLVHLRAEHHGDYARLVLDALSDACGPGTTAP